MIKVYRKKSLIFSLWLLLAAARPIYAAISSFASKSRIPSCTQISLTEQITVSLLSTSFTARPIYLLKQLLLQKLLFSKATYNYEMLKNSKVKSGWSNHKAWFTYSCNSRRREFFSVYHRKHPSPSKAS